MLFTLAAMAGGALMKEILVTDFGADPTGRTDSTQAVTRAIEACPEAGGKVVFPKGEYHFHREKGHERDLYLSNSDVVNPRRISLLIEGRKGLTLAGKGAKLIFHDRVMPLAILKSQSISISGLTIDWERPLMSQGKIIESGQDGFTLEIDQKENPYVVEGGKLYFTDTTWKRGVWSFMEFDPKTRGVEHNTGDGGITNGEWWKGPVTEIRPGVVKFSFKCTRFPKVGNILVARHGSRDHAGAFILDSKNISLTDMAFRHTSGLGILSQYSENLTFKNVDVAPDPKSGRMYAGHDDGLHFSNCKGQILVEGCEFQGLMDDPINVHGTSGRVMEKLAPDSLKCRFMHGQSIGLRFGDVGDKVSFLDHETLLSRGLGKIKAITDRTEDSFTVQFEGRVPYGLNTGDALENLTWTPDFTVRKSIFGRVRARGLLVSTPGRVLVEDNLFLSSGAAILIAGDANGWYESGAVTDVTIRRNRFEDCNTSPYQFGEAVISIFPEIPRLGDKPFHRNIRIEDNSFLAFDSPILWAKSVGGLTFRNNRIKASSAYPPRMKDRPGLTFIGCEEVSVSGNKVSKDFLGKGARIDGGKKETFRVDGWPASE